VFVYHPHRKVWQDCIHYATNSTRDRNSDWSSCGYVLLNTKQVNSETFPRPISWPGMEKLNLTHKSTHSPIKTNVLRHKINTKKTKARLSHLHDIRPGNGEGLFWFRCFINLSLTYLLTYLDTYPLTYSPGTYTGLQTKTCNLFRQQNFYVNAQGAQNYCERHT